MKLPVIHIDQIPDGGLQKELVLDPAWLDEVLGSAELTTFPGGKAHASLRLDRDERNVFLSGIVEASARATCVACLEPVDLALRASLKLNLEPAVAKPGRPAHDEVELTRDELDVDVYADDLIDLGYWLREALLLEAPLHPRHDECPVKIEMPAQPRATVSVDPRLAPLARLMKKE